MTWFPTFQKWVQLLQRSRANPRAASGLFPASQSNALLRILSLATDERLDLPPLLRAFAQDQIGAWHWRVWRLAELLESGSSLSAALEQVEGLLADRDVLSIRCATQSGTLAETLRSMCDESRHVHEALENRFKDSLAYYATVFVVTVLIIAFLLIKIFPTYQGIFADFAMVPPAPLSVLIQLGDTFWRFIGIVLLLGLAGAWVLWTRPNRPLRLGLLMHLLQPWSDARSAELMHDLSITSRAGRPISGVLSTLARYHQDEGLRRKLLFVRNEVEQGEDVWQSMRGVGLLSRDEVALLEAAVKVGNRPWAMQQIATRKRVRLNRRLELFCELLHPMAMLVLGCVIALVASAVFLPLVRLIQSFA